MYKRFQLQTLGCLKQPLDTLTTGTNFYPGIKQVLLIFRSQAESKAESKQTNMVMSMSENQVESEQQQQQQKQQHQVQIHQQSLHYSRSLSSKSPVTKEHILQGPML